MTIDTAQLLDQATPRTVLVTVTTRGDLVDAHDILERQLATQRQPNGGSLAGEASPDLTEIAEQLVAIEAEMEECSATYSVRSLGHLPWTDLKRQYPPSRDEIRQGLDVDMAKFPNAAIAACCTPAITIDQAEKLGHALPEGEWNKLWSAVLGVNMGVMDTPKSGAAAAILRMNAS